MSLLYDLLMRELQALEAEPTSAEELEDIRELLNEAKGRMQ